MNAAGEGTSSKNAWKPPKEVEWEDLWKMVPGVTVLGLLFLSSKDKDRHMLVHSLYSELGGRGNCPGGQTFFELLSSPWCNEVPVCPSMWDHSTAALPRLTPISGWSWYQHKLQSLVWARNIALWIQSHPNVRISSNQITQSFFTIFIESKLTAISATVHLSQFNLLSIMAFLLFKKYCAAIEKGRSTKWCNTFNKANICMLTRHSSYLVMVMAFSVEIPLIWFEISLATSFFSPSLVGVHIISDFMILPGIISLRTKEKPE